MSYPMISADSHVTEPPNAYIDNIDPAYRDRAPHLEHVEGAGDMFVIEGLKVPIPLGIVAAAGKELLAEHTGALTAEQRRAILCENVAELYRIDLAAIAS